MVPPRLDVPQPVVGIRSVGPDSPEEPPRGFERATENIAQGQPDPASVMADWMTSDGHRANILNPAYASLGVGVHVGAGGPWWVQDFLTP